MTEKSSTYFTSLKRAAFIYSVIAIEGYIVLSTELLAIRTTIPYVGSGSDTLAIIIAAVLLPLAVGYHRGGQFRPFKLGKSYFSIRRKLILNLLIASFILMIGFSYDFMLFFFETLFELGVNSRIAQTSTFALIFLVTPTYLLGQTAPLMSNYFARERLSSAAGKILFFSTLGSFLGAIISSIVLMPYVGVQNTITLNFILCTILVISLNKAKMNRAVFVSFAITATAIMLNSPNVMYYNHIVRNNEYNTIQVGANKEGTRILKLNGNTSTAYGDDGTVPHFIELADKLTKQVADTHDAPINILALGAGGFTYGHSDERNYYTYVDLDDDLKEIAEKHFLKKPLGENKSFIAQPARGFLMRDKNKYEVIFVDLHLGAISIPEHLVTCEFFMQIKNHLKPNGVAIFNMALSPNFKNAATRNIDTTMRAVFPYLSRDVLRENYNLGSQDENLMRNIFYIYQHDPKIGEPAVYTDDKNSLFKDKPPVKPLCRADNPLE